MLLAVGVLLLLVAPERLDRAGAFAGVGLTGVLIVCGLNSVRRDSSAAAQAFLAFPVLWAPTHLHRGAAVAITVGAVGGNAITLSQLLPAGQTVVDAMFFGSVLVVTAGMLDRFATTQERLVTA